MQLTAYFNMNAYLIKYAVAWVKVGLRFIEVVCTFTIKGAPLHIGKLEAEPVADPAL